MRKWTDYLLAVLAAIGLAGTLLSLVKTAAWQIRMLDMLREPVMYAAIALALVAILLATRWRVVLAAVFALIACIQAVNLWPYFPLANKQVALFQPDEGECFKVLSLNVEQANDQYDRVARLIDAEQPDLLLLMETDQKWADALQPQLAGYPEKVSRPLDNTYGMIFATSLDVTGADIVSDAGLDTPTLYASLTGPAAPRLISSACIPARLCRGKIRRNAIAPFCAPITRPPRLPGMWCWWGISTMCPGHARWRPCANAVILMIRALGVAPCPASRRINYGWAGRWTMCWSAMAWAFAVLIFWMMSGPITAPCGWCCACACRNRKS